MGIEPGWFFDIAAGDHSRLVQMRRDVWKHYREQNIEQPVTVRWYEGLRLKMRLGNDMSLCLYVGGSYEPNEFALIAAAITPGMVFVDGGANDGYYSLFAATKVGEHGRVVAVEPSSREYDRLVANVGVNKLRNITALRIALGREPGESTLAIAEEEHSGQNTVGDRIANVKVRAVRHEPVRVESLDSLVETQGLQRVDFVKLDVEGSEFAVLEGAAGTIERHRPLLQIEVEEERLASQNVTKQEIARMLGGYGYELWVFDSETGQLRSPRPPDEPEGNVIAAPAGWRPPALSETTL